MSYSDGTPEESERRTWIHAAISASIQRDAEAVFAEYLDEGDEPTEHFVPYVGVTAADILAGAPLPSERETSVRLPREAAEAALSALMWAQATPEVLAGEAHQRWARNRAAAVEALQAALGTA